MCINNAIYKDNKKNYDTKIFKIIKTVGYNCASMVNILCDIDLYRFTPYDLKGQIITKKCFRLFLMVTKGTEKTQLKEAIRIRYSKINMIKQPEISRVANNYLINSKRTKSMRAENKKRQMLFPRQDNKPT